MFYAGLASPWCRWLTAQLSWKRDTLIQCRGSGDDRQNFRKTEDMYPTTSSSPSQKNFFIGHQKKKHMFIWLFNHIFCSLTPKSNLSLSSIISCAICLRTWAAFPPEKCIGITSFFEKFIIITRYFYVVTAYKPIIFPCDMSLKVVSYLFSIPWYQVGFVPLPNIKTCCCWSKT